MHVFSSFTIFLVGESLCGVFSQLPTLRPLSLVPMVPDYNVVDEHDEPAWTPPPIAAMMPRG